MNKGIVFMGMGFELLGIILGCLYVGQVVDKEMGWPGYGLIVFVIGGLIGWMIHLIFMLRKFMDDGSENHDT